MRWSMPPPRAAASASRLPSSTSRAQDLRIEAERAAQERAAAEAGLRARAGGDGGAARRAGGPRVGAGRRARRRARRRTREFRRGEQEVAGIAARLRSLEELDAARAEYGDGARLVLAESERRRRPDGFGRRLSRGRRPATSARSKPVSAICSSTSSCARTSEAAAGLRFAAERNAGRVGFLVAERGVPARRAGRRDGCAGVMPVRQLVRVSGPAEAAQSRRASPAPGSRNRRTRPGPPRPWSTAPVATLDGIVYRGPHQVEGGARAEARGILATKREIKELRERLEVERERASNGCARRSPTLDVAVAGGRIGHRLGPGASSTARKRTSSASSCRCAAARTTPERLARKQEQIGIERRTAEEELRAQEARQEEARASIIRIEEEQRGADDRLNHAQRRLFEAREAMQAQARRTAEAKAAHAALTERATALSRLKSSVSRRPDASSKRGSPAARRARCAPRRAASSCARRL